ncbi:MAG: FAD:protein FMN transferase, partial [Gammaproteobacteria bacterium]|nr:FAD:protein FMN transferase [Gammaproteobacteria bacterium]
QPAKQYDYSIFAFGTIINVVIYGADKLLAESAFAQLQADFDRYHQHWSPWTTGDLAQINNKLNKNTAAQLPEHLIPIIQASIELSQQSNNFYNPTIGQLINLWQFHKYQDNDIHPPEKKRIQELIKKNPVMADLSLDGNNILSTSNTAVSLNFGAFAKGYAIELGIKRLQTLGIQNAVINAGGDLSVIGKHGDRAWNIGIRHPRKDNVLASVEVKNNESVFTSGDYERFYSYQGKRYHHILDPRTGHPTQDTQSVTVIHQDAGRADAAATALFVAGSEHWQQIAENMQIHYVMLIDSAGNIHMTPEMQKRINFLNKSPTSHIILSEEL